MKTLLLAILTGTLLTLSGCGGGGGGGTAGGGGGGGGTVTRRDASVRAAQGFLTFDRISPSQNWIFNSGLDVPRSTQQRARGLRNFLTLASMPAQRGTPPPSDYIQEFDLGLWYKPTVLSPISTRFDLREVPTNPATDAGSITVTRTSAPSAPPAFEVNLAITRGNFPITGTLRYTFQDEALVSGRLVADYQLAAGTTPIRLQYDNNFDINGYAGIFTVTRGTIITAFSNVENVDAFSRVIADFTSSGFTGSVTQETIDGSFTVFLQGEVVGQDWVITVDGNGSAVITPPNLPAEAPVSLLSL
jgi:hypothetical protein